MYKHFKSVYKYFFYSNTCLADYSNTYFKSVSKLVCLQSVREYFSYTRPGNINIVEAPIEHCRCSGAHRTIVAVVVFSSIYDIIFVIIWLIACVNNLFFFLTFSRPATDVDYLPVTIRSFILQHGSRVTCLLAYIHTIQLIRDKIFTVGVLALLYNIILLLF